MISVKFFRENVLLEGRLQTDAKNSNFEISESILHVKSWRMPLILTRNVLVIKASLTIRPSDTHHMLVTKPPPHSLKWSLILLS